MASSKIDLNKEKEDKFINKNFPRDIMIYPFRKKKYQKFWGVILCLIGIVLILNRLISVNYPWLFWVGTVLAIIGIAYLVEAVS
ncbi:MAG: hypothetical protein ACP5NV_03480 [Candidatus Woesearchaeota archaeon]